MGRKSKKTRNRLRKLLKKLKEKRFIALGFSNKEEVIKLDDLINQIQEYL